VSEKRLILHKVAYFDAVNGKFEKGKSIVVKNDSIAWIGDESSFEKEENDERNKRKQKLLDHRDVEASKQIANRNEIVFHNDNKTSNEKVCQVDIIV